MAKNIFTEYGLREVANVYFEALAAEGGCNAGDIVLYIDTAKVSTIEQTAENTEARGGWGNPSLIMWDYNKEINLTLEDALMTMESLRLMMGGELTNATTSSLVTVHKNLEVVMGTTPAAPTAAGTAYKWTNMTKGTRGQNDVTGLSAGDKVRFFWTETKNGSTGNEAMEIKISPSKFPGSYKVVGDTLIRCRDDAADESFQFVIAKCKILSEVTLTMAAEGDPSTFSMTIRCMKDDDGNMMSLIKY